MESLKSVFSELGGVTACASAAGVTDRAVYKWFANGLPRTEYTGETNYVDQITKKLGGDKAKILEVGKKQKTQSEN